MKDAEKGGRGLLQDRETPRARQDSRYSQIQSEYL
jgi:hypothetical protein